MTPALLATLRAAGESATPGPWDAYSASCCPDMGGVNGPGRRVCASQVGRYGHPSTIEDASFISLARNHWGELLDEIDGLRRDLTEAQDGIVELADEIERLKARVRVSHAEEKAATDHACRLVDEKYEARGYAELMESRYKALSDSFGTIRMCIDCGCLVGGGPTRCGRCARDANAKEEVSRG